MDTPPKRTPKALAARHKTQAADEKALAELHAAIADDLADGVKQADLVRLTGYSREHIRKIAKARSTEREGPATDI